MKLISIFLIASFFLGIALIPKVFSQSLFTLTIKPAISLSLPTSNYNHIYPSPDEEPGFSLGSYLAYTLGTRFKAGIGIEVKRKVMCFCDTYFEEEEHNTRGNRDAVDQIGIPLYIRYYSSTDTQEFYFAASFSPDFYIGGTRKYVVNADYEDIMDLSSHYSKTEFSIQLELGGAVPISKTNKLEISLAYAFMLANPNDEKSISVGFTQINILRLGAGVIFSL